jgi:hypothetical protein
MAVTEASSRDRASRSLGASELSAQEKLIVRAACFAWRGSMWSIKALFVPRSLPASETSAPASPSRARLGTPFSRASSLTLAVAPPSRFARTQCSTRLLRGWKVRSRSP